MIKNDMKFTFRNLLKHKTITTIKITGLALALTVCMAIFMWIQHETSFDKFHKNADATFRLVLDKQVISCPPGVKQLLSNIPEIDYTVRLFNSNFLGGRTKVAFGNRVFTNNLIYYADKDFFNLFSFPLVLGDTTGILLKPNAAVITHATAEKYFGNENPIGKTLLLSDSKEIEITGVMKNIPSNSHFHFDILVTMASHPWAANRTDLGSSWVFPTYIKLNNKANTDLVIDKINQALLVHPEKPEFKATLQPLTDIHLHSDLYGELENNGDIKYIYLFSAIGLLIMLIAGINYVNLTTALAVQRTREIGIRKAIGAEYRQLFIQIMGESILVALFSFAFALVLLNVMRPLFSSFIGVAYFTEMMNKPWIYLAALVFTIIIGAATGLFPAFTLTRNKIIDSLKSGFAASLDKKRARGLLVGFQFCISIILISGTLVIYQQMQYIQHKKLGYNKDHVLVIHAGYDVITRKSETLKSLLASNPDIINATFASQLPTDIKTPEGFNTKDGTRHETHYINVDKDFFKVMGMQLIEGEEQVAGLTSQEGKNWRDWNNVFVVNQSLLNEINITPDEIDSNPIMIRHGNMVPGPIIGVVKDFHFKSLHTPIEPLVFEFNPGKKEFMLIRINSEHIPKTIHYIKDQWDQLADGLPFEYHFLDESYNTLYTVETRTGHLFLVFTLISLFIIILGLLGLISFMTNRRTKEIGIRKVLGAPVENIVLLLSTVIVKWAVIANLIALPIAWYAMHKWLENFAYRIQLNGLVFLLAGFMALVIALLTVAWQVFRAATADPVKALRYE